MEKAMIKKVLIFTALIAAATIGLLNAKQMEQEPIEKKSALVLRAQELAETKIIDYTFEFIPNLDEPTAVVEAPTEIVDYTFVFSSRQPQ
jgi:hypothetical protein